MVSAWCWGSWWDKWRVSLIWVSYFGKEPCMGHSVMKAHLEVLCEGAGWWQL